MDGHRSGNSTLLALPQKELLGLNRALLFAVRRSTDVRSSGPVILPLSSRVLSLLGLQSSGPTSKLLHHVTSYLQLMTPV
jgi:hypothetical protein